MKYFFCFLLLFSTSFASQISNKTETSFEISFSKEKTKQKSSFVLFSYESNTELSSKLETALSKSIPELKNSTDLTKLKPVDGIYILGKVGGLGKVNIVGAKYATKFYLSIYKLEDGKYELEKSLSSSTLAQQPKVNATDIIFKNTDTDHLFITWKPAINSEGALLLISKDKAPLAPKDGEVYRASQHYGQDTSLVQNGTYALYFGRKKFNEFIKIDHLKYGTYYFQVYSYNGAGEAINYNTDKAQANPREVTTKLPPPKLNDDVESLDETFGIGWSKVEAASTYEVQVSYDPAFLTFVEHYDTIDVGNTTIYEIVKSEQEKVMYVRVRAKDGRNISNWSNIIEVED
jgi:hypothetical protein